MEKLDNEAYRGNYFINTTSKYKPGIVDKKLVQITDSNEIYPGCYGRVSIRAKAEDDFSIIDDEDILS